MRYLGPAAVVLGIVVAIVGALFQIYGAAAVVFCSVIGAGLVLIVAGAIVWFVEARRHGTPTALAA
jgi:hypothetical protein